MKWTNWSIKLDLSWLFPSPAPPLQSAAILSESSDVAQMNADIEKKIDAP